MLLKELFSPIGGPETDGSDINWVEDLKVFIDNDSDVLTKYFFPAIKKHREMGDHPTAYKIYMKPIETCAKDYMQKFEIPTNECGNMFPKEDLISLAKKMAEEQNNYIRKGDYENKSAL